VQYKEAKNVQVGDTLLVKHGNGTLISVQEIRHVRRYHMIYFRYAAGELSHKEVLLPTRAAGAGDVPFLCCDCIRHGPCCDYSENTKCRYRMEDGSCWTGAAGERSSV